MYTLNECLVAGLIKGDEIMVINSAIVSDLDMMYLESALQEELSLSMMMRSSRTEPPQLPSGSRIVSKTTDDIIQSLVCPPPPTDPPVISEEMISGLIVPAPGWSELIKCNIFYHGRPERGLNDIFFPPLDSSKTIFELLKKNILLTL